MLTPTKYLKLTTTVILKLGDDEEADFHEYQEKYMGKWIADSAGDVWMITTAKEEVAEADLPKEIQEGTCEILP